MYTNSRGAAHAYASVSLETSVMAASLDKKADYDLAVRLAALYDYMSQRLLRLRHIVCQYFCKWLTP